VTDIASKANPSKSHGEILQTTGSYTGHLNMRNSPSPSVYIFRTLMSLRSKRGQF
jgi:hypothetical protein